MTNLIYEVVHTSPELKTVQDYIEDINSPAHKYIQNPDKFLTVKNNQGITNRQSIEATYITKAEQNAYKGKSTSVMILKVGTKLAIEHEMIDRVGLLTQGLEVVSNDIPAFKAKKLAELESKEGYRIMDRGLPIRGNVQLGSFKEQYPDMTVWIWCRSLSSESNNFEGQIFNVTPFIQRICTSVGKNGGNFQIGLPPLTCEMNEEGKWVIKKQSIQFYINKNKGSLQGDGYIAESNLYEYESNKEMIRSQFLFHNMIGTNDLVLIRFETLKLEADQRIDDIKKLTISKNNLPDRVYDMIGLVDNNSVNLNAASNEVNISITGRDLSKLFIEDGTYFFSLELNQGMIGGPGSKGKQGGLTQRLASDSALQYLSLYFNNSIEKVFEFVINQLSNIKVVPDSLFDAYGDRRNTRFTAQSDDKKLSNIDTESNRLELACLQQIADIRSFHNLTLLSVNDERQVLRNVFNEQKRFQQAIRDQKVRQVLGSITLGWSAFKYNSITGVTENIEDNTYPQYFVQNLYNLQSTRIVSEDKSLVIQIDQILDLEQSKPKYKDQLTKEIAPGIWQIIKLVIDKGITQRRLVDSSISTANGSLLNFFRKVCQEPFVEFYMDTYGDQYFLIARKPPTDLIGVTSMLDATVVTEDNNGQVAPAVIEINAEDVITDSFSFSDEEAISWYHLVPQANFFGGNDAFSLAYLPAVHFEEYADIWGSKPMQLVHNYLPMIAKDPNTNNLDIAQKQAVEDMRYMIESSAHLPFTRRGQIRLNGDRRLKVGNILRYKPTGEIFLIDGVRQDYSISDGSIDRTTTVDVSRGMVEKLIRGIQTPQGKLISYFNIINTKPVYEYKDYTTYKEETIQTGTRVISDSTSNDPTVDTSKLSYPDNRIVEKGNSNMQLLNGLTPIAKKRFTQFINAINANLGYHVHIESGRRSFEEQKALHNANPKGAAKEGHSEHENGNAIDINLFTKKLPAVWIKKASTTQTWIDTGVPQLASVMGLIWGGSAFRDNYDPVHFLLQTAGSANITTTRTEPVYITKRTPIKSKALDVSKIFSNFKVDKEVFNFFITRQQFNKDFLR